MTEQRKLARDLARASIERGDPTGWFEKLYAQAAGDNQVVPWADMQANPNLVTWLERNLLSGVDKTALIVGCGLGDDAEAIQQLGFRVTAFDISATAIDWCKQRFPNSEVDYTVADLLECGDEWRGTFDFVFESYTLQVLPPGVRTLATRNLASFVGPSGKLLVIARGRDATDPKGEMPWPLTRAELDMFVNSGLMEIEFEDFMDNEDPPVRRFRALFQRL